MESPGNVPKADVAPNQPSQDGTYGMRHKASGEERIVTSHESELVEYLIQLLPMLKATEQKL